MTARTFAPWVGPVAAELRESRRKIVRTARQLLPEQWSHPSPLETWTYKDLLAHLAVGDWVFQTILGAVVENRPANLSVLAQLNERNEQYRSERSSRSVEELIREVEIESEESQELLARLIPDDEGRRQSDAPVSLGDYLRMFPSHDRDHLAQLRTALDQVML